MERKVMQLIDFYGFKPVVKLDRTQKSRLVINVNHSNKKVEVVTNNKITKSIWEKRCIKIEEELKRKVECLTAFIEA